MKNNNYVVSSKSVFKTLLIIACLLVFASIVGQLIKFVGGHPTVFGLVQLFNVGVEQNIPTLFSVLLLLICAFLMGTIFTLHRIHNAKSNMYWVILTIGFTLMGIDEFVSLHEKIGYIVAPLMPGVAHGIFYYSWVIPAIFVVLFFGLFFLKFLISLPKEIRISFIVAGAVYLAGVIGVEMLGGRYHELHGRDSLSYSMITNLEESLEMLGLILFIRALLDYLSIHFSELFIQLRS